MRQNRSLCKGAATYRNNVLAGGTCGSTDVGVGSLRFVDGASSPTVDYRDVIGELAPELKAPY